MSEVGLVTALAAGVLALLSPCSALLLPSFFAYAFGSTGALLGRTFAFYLGLLLTLVPLGVGVGFASHLFYGHRPLLISVAGWSIIGLGTLQLLGRGFSVPFVQRFQTALAGAGGTSYLSTVALGAVYGLAGFCSGPILGAILTIAATQSSPAYGGILLAVYALGMTAPLLALAMTWDRFDLGRRRWLRGRSLEFGPLRLHTASIASGLLFIVIGVLFLRFDGTAGITGVLGLGDTTGLELDAQQVVAGWTSSLPAWSLPLLVLVVALFVAGRRMRASRVPVDPAGSDESSSS